MRITQFLGDEDGQTLVEYGLLISLIALVVIAVVTLFGTKVKGMWGSGASKYPDPVTQ